MLEKENYIINVLFVNTEFSVHLRLSLLTFKGFDYHLIRVSSRYHAYERPTQVSTGCADNNHNHVNQFSTTASFSQPNHAIHNLKGLF